MLPNILTLALSGAICGLAVSVTRAMAAPGASQSLCRIVAITAHDTTLSLEFETAGSTDIRLVELRPYEDYRPGAAFPVVWSGKAGQAPIVLPRFDGTRDRLYSKFQPVDPGTGQPLGDPGYVTDLALSGIRTFDFPRPRSIKGLTCPVDLDDVVALGVKYINDNVNIASVFDLGSAHPSETWDVDGEKLPVNTSCIHLLDNRFRKLTDAGINVTVVLNNPVPRLPNPVNPFIHPATDLARAPNHLGAFNITDEQGLRCYRGAIEYLANRYSQPGHPYGWITGFIVGNELQAHWEWYNLGRMPANAVVEQYARALRVTDLAVRRFHSKLRVYVSMDHHWSLLDGDPLHRIRGDERLKKINALTNAEGDFPWDVAFHPYPEDLFNPRSWNDRTATLGFDTRRITFKNIEVLPAFLRQPEFLYRGQPRRIILSEQGLDSSRAGEEVQAAAYAYAYYRCSHTPGIDAFMLHRHVDHAGEGGLMLGLWTYAPGTVSTPGRKKRIWEVFRDADTPDWKQAFAFALPIIGIKDWAEIDPVAKIGAVSPPPAPPRPIPCPAAGLALVDHVADAVISNCADWRQSSMEIGGQKQPTIFQHPPAEGDGDASFRITLPPIVAGQRIVFQFATAFSGPTENGARFVVLVDGKERFRAEQTTVAPIDRTVDLTDQAGKTITLTLRINALGNTAYDWANWVEPRLKTRPTPHYP